MEKLNYEKQAEWVAAQCGDIQSPIWIQRPYVNSNDKKIFQTNSNFFVNSMVNKINNLSMDASGVTMVDGRQFTLQEIHVHHVAEHGFEGEEELRPLEIHFVHRNILQQILVVAVTLKIGRANPVFEKILAGMDAQFNIIEKIDVSSLIPKAGSYYRYLGSLTTPPLSEGVEWIVFKDAQEVSLTQLDRYVDNFPEHNNRDFQKLNQRQIQEYQL